MSRSDLHGSASTGLGCWDAACRGQTAGKRRRFSALNGFKPSDEARLCFHISPTCNTQTKIHTLILRTGSTEMFIGCFHLDIRVIKYIFPSRFYPEHEVTPRVHVFTHRLVLESVKPALACVLRLPQQDLNLKSEALRVHRHPPPSPRSHLPPLKKNIEIEEQSWLKRS